MSEIFNNIISGVGITDVIDVAIVAFVIYKVLGFIRETRALQLVKGLLVLVLITVLSDQFNLYTLNWILRNTLQLGVIALFFSLSIAASLINFGALLGFAVVNVTVIMHYYIKMKDRNVIKHLLIPAIGAIYTLIMLVSLNGTSLIFGLIWEVIGFTYLLLTTNGFRRLPAEITEI